MGYKITVDKETCIACGTCYSLDSEHFESDAEGKSEAKGGEVKDSKSVGEFEEGKDSAKEAARACPVDAITVKE